MPATCRLEGYYDFVARQSILLSIHMMTQISGNKRAKTSRFGRGCTQNMKPLLSLATPPSDSVYRKQSNCRRDFKAKIFIFDDYKNQ